MMRELPSAADVLTDPSTSTWLHAALSAALDRDPVDAANDAETLSRVLSLRVQDALKTV